MTVRTRIEKLESAAGTGNVTLEELVNWSYRKDREGAEYEEFAKRCANSRLGRLICKAGGGSHETVLERATR